MYLIKLFTGAVCALATLAAGELRAETDHKMSLSVVQVRAFPGEGRVMFGSGVAVSPNRVATNCHVTRNARKIMVSKGPQWYSAVAQQADTHRDLCLLTIPDMPFPVAEMGSATQLTVGQPLYFYGYPRAIGITFSEGQVQALHPYEDGQIIETSADFTLGGSGGGVFDRTGKLVGLATFLTAGHSGGYYAVPADWIASLKSREAKSIEPQSGLTFWEDKAAWPLFLRPPTR